LGIVLYGRGASRSFLFFEGVTGVSGAATHPMPVVLCVENFGYLIELAVAEKMLFALDPIKRTVPTTIRRMTATITAYSAMSWPLSSRKSLRRRTLIFYLLANLTLGKERILTFLGRKINC
jgi:hypothetical protein